MISGTCSRAKIKNKNQTESAAREMLNDFRREEWPRREKAWLARRWPAQNFLRERTEVAPNLA
jgi:hypothetical protein